MMWVICYLLFALAIYVDWYDAGLLGVAVALFWLPISVFLILWAIKEWFIGNES